MTKRESEAPAVGYDPGWGAQTWVGAEPEPTPAKTMLDKARAAARILVFAAFSLPMIPIFFIARALGRDRAIAGIWLRGCARLLGLRIERRGAAFAAGALLANHQSWIDILALGGSAPVHFVSKAEVAGWPFFGWIGKISNTVFIERRRGHVKSQEALLAGRAAEGQLLCLFPEGTSTDGQRVLPFKSALLGAFFADAESGRGATMVQPVSVVYRPRRGLPRSFYGWWGKRGIFGHIWDVLCLSRGGVVEVAFHAPLDPSDFTDRKALAATAQAAVASAVAAALGA